MKNKTQITFNPSYEWNNGGTRWQQCDILNCGKLAGYERSCFPWNIFKEPKHYVNTVEMFDKAEAENLASKYKAEVFEEPYGEDSFYLCFEGNDRYSRFESFLNRK
jgi:hypothetical protein